MQEERFYDFGEFRIDRKQRLLSRAGREVALSPRLYEMLLALVEQHGRIVTHEDLLQTVWRGAAVEPASIKVSISALRRALGESASAPCFIETIPRRGYRFIAPVTTEQSTQTLLQAASPEQALTAPFDSLPSAAPEPAPLVSFSSFGPTSTAPRNAWRRRSLAAVALILLLSASVGYYWQYFPMRAATPTFPAMRITKLTNTGNVAHAVVAPDGAQVAYTVAEEGGKSLWLRQTDSTEATRLLPPLKNSFWGLTFAPDGQALYYVVEEETADVGVLYRLPLQGGTPQRLLTQVNSAVSFAPDGRQFAFIRLQTTAGLSHLMIANSAGSDVRVIATRQLPQAYWDPAWSPDGQRIACAALNLDAESKYWTVVTLPVMGGAEQPVGGRRWRNIAGLSWLPAGDGLTLAASAPQTEGGQLWRLTYPGGEARRITNDLSIYSEPSLTADGRVLTTVQQEQLSTLWIAPANDISSRRVAVRAGRINGVAWTPGDQLVYDANASGRQELWIMEADGGKRRQLTNAADVSNSPAIAPDGRGVFFVSNRTGKHQLWRFAFDTSQTHPLTDGDDYFPQPTPDGQWLIYAAYGTHGWQLMKVPAAGGTPVAFSEEEAYDPAVSPDGRWLAYKFRNPRSHRWEFGVRALAGNEPPRVFKLGAGQIGTQRWTNDSRAFSYFSNEHDQSHLWLQPLSGEAPRRLVTLQGETVYFFAWSQDGRRLAFVTSLSKHDVALLRSVE